MRREADLTPTAPTAESAAEEFRLRSAANGVLRRALRHHSLAVGLLICVLLALMVFFLPLVMSSVDLNAQDPMATFSPPRQYAP